MDAIIQHSPPLSGTLQVPPDKAICHRAVLVGALADGLTEIHPWPEADDCQRTLQLVEALGLQVSRSGDTVQVHGRGQNALRQPGEALECGESGTTLRLAAGLLAGQPMTATLAAAPSLKGRPMRRIIEPLTRMGAHIEGTRAAEHPGEWYPPLTIRGTRPLRAMRYEMRVASAQVKSAILLAGLFADGPTTVSEPVPTRDHTERLLRHCGITVERRNGRVTVAPGQLSCPGRLRVPGDFSSAAFLIVAAACVAGSSLALEDVSLNPTRVGLLAQLARMGAQIRADLSDEPWEPRGRITLEARPLQAIRLTPAEVPAVIDELPVLMVAAACAAGTSRFEGVGELRVKETDRIQSMVDGLRGLGVRVGLPAPDAVEITGGRLVGAPVDSAGDHRTAMSLSVAGLVASGQTRLRGAECVSKSFPEFFGLLGRLAGSSTVKTIDKAGPLC